GHAEGPERRRVDQEARAEAGDRAEDRAAEERDREQRHEHDARAPELPVLRQHGELQQRRGEEDECSLEAVHYFLGTRTITDCSEEKSTVGLTWMFLNGLMSFELSLVTVPIWMPRGNIDGSLSLPIEPAVMIVSPCATYFAFDTRSITSTSLLPPPGWMIPTAVGLVRSSAVTALWLSVSSVTCPTCPKSRSTVPTRPPLGETTRVPTLMPPLPPAPIVPLWSIAFCGFVITTACTWSKSAAAGGAWYCSWLFSSTFSCTADSSRITCWRSRAFSA